MPISSFQDCVKKLAGLSASRDNWTTEHYALNPEGTSMQLGTKLYTFGTLHNLLLVCKPNALCLASLRENTCLTNSTATAYGLWSFQPAATLCLHICTSSNNLCLASPAATSDLTQLVEWQVAVSWLRRYCLLVEERQKIRRCKIVSD